MKTHSKLVLLLALLTVSSMSFFSCIQDNASSDKGTASTPNLNRLNSSETGINFRNQVDETPTDNFITYDGFYQGAGVGILDVNNDGLKDIYFAGNQVSDQLYLNKGDFKFENITKNAGISDDGTWSTGVCVFDANQDGFDDIYVLKFMYDQPEKRVNQLWLNQKNNTFKESALDAGLADGGYGIMANAFDYDNDGDLDLYVANQPPNSIYEKAKLKGLRDYQYSDKFYKNNGNGTFTDVSLVAGIKNYCYSLSATAFDYNNDGFTDLYVAADYDEPDLLYKNNGNGTFTNVADQAIRHMSNFSMGADIADINHDGHQDLFVVDMVAEDNYRLKTSMSGMNPKKFWSLYDAGYHLQYMFNALQLNNGDGSFSEIAQMAGVSSTDWSWAPLFIDLDNDSYQDIIVTNGLAKELRNKDFEIARKKIFKEKQEAIANGTTDKKFIDPLEITKIAPSVKIKNYILKNNGDLTFSSKSSDWGFEKEGWSQGAAYADFDLDGDFDLVLNNLNDVSEIYENNSAQQKGNFINVVLDGTSSNKKGVGSEVTVVTENKNLKQIVTPYRGYMSSVEPALYFGLADETVRRIDIKWADGKETSLANPKVNTKVILKHSVKGVAHKNTKANTAYYEQSNAVTGVGHVENEFDDYQREILLPYKLSCQGPVAAIGDVNGDNQDDVILGSSANQSPIVLVQNGGKFNIDQQSFVGEENYEESGVALFDLEGDGDLDVYMASGSNEWKQGSSNYRDRLYINDGKGNFKKSNQVPKINTSTSVVVPMDFDKDGDLDLFVGGRQVPGFYGQASPSYILRNDQGKLKDVTFTMAPDFNELGMVTDSKWADLNGDGKHSLIVCGEWMPIRIFQFNDGKFVEDKFASLSQTNGWWNTIEIADLNNDGKKDIIAGNLGENLKYQATKEEPFQLYAKDFDDNGSHDVYLGYYDGGVCYPVRGRSCSSDQMPFVKKKFVSYDAFAKASVEDVLEGKLDNAVIRKVYTFKSTIFMNDGAEFEAIPLPKLAQIAPVNGIVLDDVDQNGFVDIIVAGNEYNREVETTRSDAGSGYVILNKDGHEFEALQGARTGFIAARNARGLYPINVNKKKGVLVLNNNDGHAVFVRK